MKKLLSVIMAVVMLLSISSVAAFAAETYEIVFADCPYDIAPYRTDYVGKYMGYQYGVDYWFTITNEDGTTTDIKGFPYSVEVTAGKALEFTVSVADYVEPTSVRMLAFPRDMETANLYDSLTGEPFAQYHIARSQANTYGVVPQEDLTICLSEFHLFNDCFLYNFPKTDYYETKRVQYNAEAINPWDMYTDFEWDNTKVIYVNETVFVQVTLPLNDPAHTYHYESYQVYYTTGYGEETTYLRKPASEKEGTEAIDLRVAHYETEEEWVDIYAIPNADPTMQFKIAGTVTYTLDMLKDFFEDFSLENLENLDMSTLDFGPLVEFAIRLLTLIMKLLAGFGLEIDISSILG